MRLGEFLWIGIFGACLVTYLLTSMSSHFYKRSVRGQLWREVSGSTWSAFLDAINPELAQWKNRQKQQPSSREVFFLTGPFPLPGRSHYYMHCSSILCRTSGVGFLFWIPFCSIHYIHGSQVHLFLKQPYFEGRWPLCYVCDCKSPPKGVYFRW